MTKSAMELDADRDPGLMDQLYVVRDEKGRSFSTSTPFVAGSELGKNTRSMSVSIISAGCDDSGLGISISDSAMSFGDISEQNTPILTDSMCTTPKLSFTSPRHNSHKRTYIDPPSPVSRWNFLTRRSLDSSFGDEHDKTAELSNASLNSSRSSCARRLNLDLDLDTESDEDIVNDTGFHQPTAHASDLYTPQQSLVPNIVSDLRQKFNESLLVEQFNDILLKFTPPVGDRLIGRKMGEEKVDIIGELEQRNVICLSVILSYLQPEDLCRMCLVSQQWKNVCNSDASARRRRKKFVREKRIYLEEMGKENASIKPPEAVVRSVTVTGPLQSLATVQLVTDTPLGPKPGGKKQRTSMDLFFQEASKLKNDEILQKCPRCCKPAKVSPVQEIGQCQSPDCNYEYCIKCMHAYHQSKDCAPIAAKRTKTDTIGSKKSKKNLKRL